MSNSFDTTVAITGAFGFTGRYAAGELLRRGYRIRTLTNRTDSADLHNGRVETFPLQFAERDGLLRALDGVDTLVNTYWVRFPRGGVTFELAIRNSRTLVETAQRAGVRRIVHISIANPSPDSLLGYYSGKAEVEKCILNSSLSYAILRPTVIFGKEDILINNIAWFVRRFPVFGVPGTGRYRISPIFVEDLAGVMADSVSESENSIRDAVGPETFTFEELVRLVADRLGRRVGIIHVPLVVAYVLTALIGPCVHDVVLTWEEYRGLVGNLLHVKGPAIGRTRLSQWLSENANVVGRNYESELARHYGSI